MKAGGARIRACLFAVRDGKVLLAEHEKAGRTYYLLPGGGVDPGEAWGDAAGRELEEELGCGARVGDLIGLFENRSPDGARHILHAVFAAEVAGDPAPTGEDPRVVGCRWVTREELTELTIFPTLGDRYARWLADGPPGGAEYAPVAWVD